MLKRNFQISSQALNQITNQSQELEGPGSKSIVPFKTTADMKPYTLWWKYIGCVFSLLIELNGFKEDNDIGCTLRSCSWPPLCHRSSLGYVEAATQRQGNSQVLIPCWCIPAASKSWFLRFSDSIDMGHRLTSLKLILKFFDMVVFINTWTPIK